MRDICCVIPAYNEGKTIMAVVEGCKRHIGRVVVIDDGSHDGTAAVAEKAGAHVIRHPKNMGKGMALRTGFSFALSEKFSAVLSLDADGQHDSSEIPRFMDALGRGS